MFQYPFHSKLYRVFNIYWCFNTYMAAVQTNFKPEYSLINIAYRPCQVKES